MSAGLREPARAPSIVRVALPQRPAWLHAMATRLAVETTEDEDGATLEVAAAPHFAILRATVPARDRDDTALRAAVRATYARFGRLLQERALHPWRIWNYVPEIQRAATIGANRYQVFNAGRCDGYRDWFGAELPGRVPAASAVGHAGSSLVIDALAGRARGVPIENPRQLPAYGYSQRWGPFPPCFTRAMAVSALPAFGASRCALVSGTGSVVGEDSRHPGDAAAQLDEIFENLAALGDAGAFGELRELRLYVARGVDADAVAAAFVHRLPGLDRLELATADLCRDELLLEAEGVAILRS